jgi:large subunit ribosomal protein LP1
LTILLKLLSYFSFQSDKINAVLKAAGYEVEPYWPGLFANALEGVKVRDLITNLGSGAAAPAAAPAAAKPAAAAKEAPAKKEEKKEEKKESEDEDMGFGELLRHKCVSIFL